MLTFTLTNGIRVIHQYVSSPVAFCGLMINTGTRDELESEHGLAHFLEHTLFKGTSKRKAYHVNSRLDNAGGELNAFTAKEETMIQACVMSSDFSKAVELIADVAFSATFPEHEINKEKQVVCEEIDLCADTPSELIFNDFEDLLFQGSSLGRNILGTKRSVNGFSSDDLLRFVGRTYNTDRMVFASTGKISEKRLRYCCDKYLAARSPNLRGFARAKAGEYKVFDRTVKKGTHQCHVVLGNRAYDCNDSRRTALSLLLNCLGGPATNSTLNLLLREKNGLVYSVETGYTAYCDTGNATLYYASSEAGAEKSHDLVMKELARVKTQLMSGFRLAKAKRQFIGQSLIAQESGEQLMQIMAKSMLAHDRFEGSKLLVKQIEAVTASDIMDVANEVFCSECISRLSFC
ncbi:MAG: insulinase family protein [Prevotellaceae bacterium]|jgi:predicted Zn-dependent peptidase|nr:insulinase family protein [Prevotellaceae bacterium]